MLSWDRLRDDVRSFRIDRIDRLEPAPDTFKLRPSERFIDAVELDARPI